jgi:hypothetical protein
MFDQVLNLVKEHLGSNPQVANTIPADKADTVHQEVASQITDNLKNGASAQGGIGGLLSKFTGGVESGSTVTSAITGGLAGSLASKFNLPPAVVGAISGAIPGLLQKFAHKAMDPNDPSVSVDSLQNSLSGSTGGLGSMFGLGK